MTKKSQSRLDRDKFIKEVKENKADDWSVLNEIKDGLGSLIINKLATAQVCVQNRDLIDAMPAADKQEFYVRVAALNMDAKIITHDLAALGDRHKDRTGTADTFEDTRDLVMLQEEYYQMQDRIDAVLVPNADMINATFSTNIDAVTYLDQLAQKEQTSAA